MLVNHKVHFRGPVGSIEGPCLVLDLMRVHLCVPRVPWYVFLLSQTLVGWGLKKSVLVGFLLETIWYLFLSLPPNNMYCTGCPKIVYPLYFLAICESGPKNSAYARERDNFKSCMKGYRYTIPNLLVKDSLQELFNENCIIHRKKNLYLDTTISSNKSSYQKYHHPIQNKLLVEMM